MHLKAACKTQISLSGLTFSSNPHLSRSLCVFLSGYRSGAFSGQAYWRAAEGV